MNKKGDRGESNLTDIVDAFVMSLREDQRKSMWRGVIQKHMTESKIDEKDEIKDQTLDFEVKTPHLKSYQKDVEVNVKLSERNTYRLYHGKNERSGKDSVRTPVPTIQLEKTTV